MSNTMHAGPFAVGPYLIGGTDQSVLFDDSGSLGSDASFTWDKVEKVLTVYEPTRATIDVIRGSVPHPAWNYANHLVFIAGQESTGGGTICAVAHAHDDATTSPECTGYRSRGTLSAPKAVQQGDRLMRYACVAWDGAAFGASGTLDLLAAENWEPRKHGTYFVVRLTERGNYTDRIALSLSDRGALQLPLATARVQIGPNAATDGAIGLANGASITARTAASQNIPLISLDSKDTIRIGSAGTAIRISPPNGGLRIDNQVSRVGTRTATLRNAPTEGDPKFWLPINIGGTTRFVPCW